MLIYPRATVCAAQVAESQRTKDGWVVFGAGDEIRTNDPSLGKVLLYP